MPVGPNGQTCLAASAWCAAPSTQHRLVRTIARHASCMVTRIRVGWRKPQHMPKTRIKPKSEQAAPVPKPKRTHAQRAPAVRSAAAVNRRLRQIEDKRAVILRAALGLFSRYGLHGTSVDQVAARADVSKSNLLYYFANKEEL